MKILADEPPTLSELVKEAKEQMSRERRRSNDYWKSRGRNGPLDMDEQVEKVLEEMEEVLQRKPFWLSKNRVDQIRGMSSGDLDFQKMLNQEYTKRGENLEFYWMWI